MTPQEARSVWRRIKRLHAAILQLESVVDRMRTHDDSGTFVAVSGHVSKMREVSLRTAEALQIACWYDDVVDGPDAMSDNDQ